MAKAGEPTKPGPHIAVAMLGARMHYAIPRIFHEAGVLEHFYTDSYIGNKTWLGQAVGWLPQRFRPRMLERLLGRKDPSLPPERVTSFETLGFYYAWARARAAGERERAQIYARIGRAFNQRIIASGLAEVEVVWGFNSACLELFEHGKRQGLRCVMEQTIAPKKVEARLMSEELVRWPGWEPGLEVADGESALAAREESEWRIADRIIAGSVFVADGLRSLGVPDENIRVVPYGVDPGRFPRSERRLHTGPLRVLFAGQVGLRKGVPDLLQALAGLGKGRVEAKLAGVIRIAHEKLDAFREIASCIGPVPRAKMADLYNWADVFVLPSIVEGSATVTYEALASGLPVITTPNAGSVVRDGVEGFVVPIRDPDALGERVRQLAEDRELLVRMGEAARTRSQDFTLERYGERVLDAMEGV